MTNHLPRLMWVALGVAALAGCAGPSHSASPNAPVASPPASRPVAKRAEMPGHDAESLLDYYGRRDRTIEAELAKAAGLEKAKRWGDAAAVYQHILEGDRDRMYPLGPGASASPAHFGNVERKVRAALEGWPREGIAAYKARFEATADAKLQSAGTDWDGLEQVRHRYFGTDAATKAAQRLKDLASAAGDWGLAARVGQALYHDPNHVDRALVLYKIGIALHRSGQDDAARAVAGMISLKQPDIFDSVNGVEIPLKSSLLAELKTPYPNPSAHAEDSWKLSIGGNADRDQIPAGDVWPDAPLYHIALALRKFGPGNGVAKQMNDRVESNPAVLPAVDRGELFFQDGRRIYAVDLDTGKPLAGWAKTYPGSGEFVLPGAADDFWQSDCQVTLTDHYVLAAMGQSEQWTEEINSPVEHVPRLVCLDRATGKLVWIISMSRVPGMRSATTQIKFIGSPLVVGSNVLVLGRSLVPRSPRLPIDMESPLGSIETHLFCFDLATGAFKWDCYLGSLPVLQEDWGQAFAPPISPLAYFDGLVYAMTNSGAVAAIDPYDGSVEWVDLYSNHAPSTQAFNPWEGQQQSLRPRVINPPIIDAGKLFALPADGRDLLILNPSNGAEIKHVNLEEFADRGTEDGDLYQDFESPLSFNTLVAADGNQITLLGRHDKASQLVCLDWTKYTKDDTAITWATATLDSVVGRCFITAGSALLSTHAQLMRVSRDGGEIKEGYPLGDRGWPENESAGNVLAIQGHVIIAGAKQVTVYSTRSTRPASH